MLTRMLSHLLLFVVSGTLLLPITSGTFTVNVGTKHVPQESMHLSFRTMVRSAERSRSPKTSIPHIKYAKKNPEQACEHHTSLSQVSFYESRTCRVTCVEVSNTKKRRVAVETRASGSCHLTAYKIY